MFQEIAQIDAFTDTPYEGNPAAVLLLPQPKPDCWMQDVAKEMNLSETAFLVAKPNSYHLRWFTPTQEVDFCGHATLASAFYLFEMGLVQVGETVIFDTKVGRIPTIIQDDWVEMDFPSFPPSPVEVDVAIRKALRINPLYFGVARDNYFIEVETEEILGGIRPDFEKLKALTPHGLMVTAPSSRGERDFVSRYFAPSFGIDEDPVTGSAHASLAPYWSHKLGKQELIGYQASQRGGTVRMRMRGERVMVAGKAVMTMKGHLLH